MTPVSVSTPGRFARRAKAILYKVLLLNYGRAARLYWELRARDLVKLYGDEISDFPTLRSILDRYRPQSVLDVGCGSGRLFPLYTESKVPHALGIDISSLALRMARLRFPTIPTRRTRIEDLSLDEKYDLVIANRVLQHLPQEDVPRAISILTQVARVSIYINEISDSEQANLVGARYIFMHNYEGLFASNGWSAVETAIIPGMKQTYRIFEPEKRGQEPSPI